MKKRFFGCFLITICILTAVSISSCKNTTPVASSITNSNNTLSEESNQTASSAANNSNVLSKENSQATSSSNTSSIVFSKEKLKKYQQMQDAENNGHRPGLLDPEEVAMDFATDITYDKMEKSVTGDHATVIFIKSGKPVLQMELYQPIKKGKFGIWAVISWTDSKTNTKHIVE